MRILLFCLFGFVFSAFAKDSKSSTHYFLSGSSQDSQRYSGTFFKLGVGKTFTKDTSVVLSGERLQRHYKGGGDVTDTAAVLGMTQVFQNETYLESFASYSSDAEITPRLNLNLTPHKVIGASDFSLGMDYREYENVKAGSLQPGLYYDVSEKYALTFNTYIVRSDDTYLSYAGSALYRPSEKQIYRLGAAAGKTLEDAGLAADFKNLYANYTYKFDRLSFILEAGRYWSPFRVETTYGLRLDFR